jgi:hypothetical protein
MKDYEEPHFSATIPCSIGETSHMQAVVGKSITTNLGYFSSGRFLMGKGLNVYCFHNWDHL